MKVNQEGFTIIELLIATAIFAVILIITTTTIIGISQTYIKGSVEGQTQQAARAILSDISQSIQFNNGKLIDLGNSTSSLPGGTNEFYFCIADDVYVYALDQSVSSSNWGLIRYRTNGCPTPPADPRTSPGAVELLANNERIGWLHITNPFGTDFYTISVEVGYGANDLLGDYSTLAHPTPYPGGVPTPPADYEYNYLCASGSDSSFCATSILTTTVEPRIND